MDIYMQQASEKLQSWFRKASKWQKDLFCTLWEGGEKDERILERTKNIIAQEYLGELYQIAAKDLFPNDLAFSENVKPPVMLKSISNIAGVGALSPQASLQFENGLTVVYGENGCGKSSYVRILKALENYANAERVLGNVFSEQSVSSKADVVFSTDGTDHTITWTKSCKTKYPIQIYDTIVAKQFVDKENEVVYEPKILAIITKMANIYEQLSLVFKDAMEKAKDNFSPLQIDVSTHPIIEEFNEISNVQKVEQFAKRYPWNNSLKTELQAIIESLAEQRPLEAAKALNAQKQIISKHERTILELLGLVNDSACGIYLKKRARQIETKRTQDAYVDDARKESILEYFGGDEWKGMWTQANAYTNLIGTAEEGIPTSKSGRCALCQQELDLSAQKRMRKFKAFVASNAITVAEKAYREFHAAVLLLQNKIENKIKINDIAESLESGMISADIKSVILQFYSEILDRCMWLLSYDEECPTTCPDVHTSSEITEEFKAILEQIDLKIIAYENVIENHNKQITRKNQLLAIKWSISNLATKKKMLLIQSILKECKTNMLTTLKKDLSRLLITDEYIRRFQNEMNILDDRGQIKVELVEATPKRGKTYHQISLRGAKAAGKHKNGEILSEGEFRVVSLAAFLADLSSWGRIVPFVFDDPITSLDQKYETRVATRLVQLSLERQVIVFTHRLAFAQLLNIETRNYNAAVEKKGNQEHASICNIQLRRFPLGCSEPPAFLKDVSLSKAIRQIRGNELPAIKRKQKEGDYVIADAMLKSLCSDFRKIIEQGICQDLLSGIVSRYGREISSLKLTRLYAMTQEDITLFHNMMSKYSCYEHSQPIETPLSLPDIEDLEADIDIMEKWAKDYEKRCEAEAHKARGTT